MPKLGMQPIRRQQLIDATIEVHGFAGTMIARVGRGTSMRWLLSEPRDGMIARQRRGQSPLARIKAIIAASFAPAQFTPRVCARLSFYAQVPHEPELARLHRVYIRRPHSNLRHAFGALLPAARVAEGMTALIDGIRARARALANDYLQMVLREHDVPTADGPSRAAAV